MQAEIGYKYLKFTSLEKTVFWDFYTLFNKNAIDSVFPIVKLSEVINQRKGFITINDTKIYKRCRVQIEGKGVVLRDEVIGKEIKTKKQQLCKIDDFLVAEIDAKVGGFGIVPPELENAIVSGHYFLFEINKLKLLPEFLGLIVTQSDFLKQVKSTGSTNYSAIRPSHVLDYKIPLPKIEEQRKIINSYLDKVKEAERLKNEADDLEDKIENYLFDELGLSKKKSNKNIYTGLQLIDFKNIQEWGLDKILVNSNKKSSKFKVVSIEENPQLAVSLFRGKSPKYKDGTSAYILNQKCNRWNNIDLTFVKSVDEDWLKSVNKNNLTKEGDVIINSTGEGTIGRATYIKSEFEGLLYDSHLLLLRLDRKQINAELFVELFNSEYGQNQVNDIKSAQATKQTELGTSNLARIQFPLPNNLDVQNKIVNKIKELKVITSKNLNKAIALAKEAQKDFEKTIFNK